MLLRRGLDLKLRIVYFWNVPLHIFRLWVTEITEMETVEKGGQLYSLSETIRY